MGWTAQFGNMYPWIDYMHSHLGGQCGHDCVYCYVGKGRWGRAPRYTGEIRLLEDEFKQNYYADGVDKTIFLEHKNDICGPGVTDEMIARIVAHAKMYPQNTYVFQTKNPTELFGHGAFVGLKDVMVGTTVETDDADLLAKYSKAPPPEERLEGIALFDEIGVETFITVEPVLRMKSATEFAMNIADANPDFVNIGADSKWSKMEEPDKHSLGFLIQTLTDCGIEIREKTNLERLMK